MTTEANQALALGKVKQVFPKIAFIGVWDTVDAYGVPMDEIKQGIDRYIWPMTLADRNLSDNVVRARQALSLDDERPSFRPVLWNEPKDDATDKASKVNERDRDEDAKENASGSEKPDAEPHIVQIWFAGVHANVGGGYPDDGLAYVTLKWMMKEAHQAGLWFYPTAWTDVMDRANEQGKQYDSRSGLAGYYRYGPRNVDKLCKDLVHGVNVGRPKIHKAALGRIRQWHVGYAPVSFPSHYTVMVPDDRDPNRLVEVQPPVQQNVINACVEDMKWAWDAVARRRWAYFATVWLTVILAGLPPLSALLHAFGGQTFSRLYAPLRTAGDKLLAVPGMPIVNKVTAKALAIVFGWIGSWTQYWAAWYGHHPFLFLVIAVPLAWLFVRKSAKLQRQVFAKADYAWRNVRDPKQAIAKPAAKPTDSLVRKLRESKGGRDACNVLTGEFIPIVLAFFAAVLALPLVIVFIPKMWRDAARRRKYNVTRSATKPAMWIDPQRRALQPFAPASTSQQRRALRA